MTLPSSIQKLNQLGAYRTALRAEYVWSYGDVVSDKLTAASQVHATGVIADLYNDSDARSKLAELDSEQLAELADIIALGGEDPEQIYFLAGHWQE